MNSQRHPDLKPLRGDTSRDDASPSAKYARRQALKAWVGVDVAGLQEQYADRADSVSALVNRVMDSLGLDRRRAETEIVKVWNQAIDPNVVAHAQPTGLKNGTLFVAVDSSVWHCELVRYRYREILRRMQHSFGSEMIQRLSFRVNG